MGAIADDCGDGGGAKRNSVWRVNELHSIPTRQDVKQQNTTHLARVVMDYVVKLRGRGAL